MVNADPEQRYIFCTPYLSEIDRVKRHTGSGRFCSPEPFYYSSEKEGYTGSSKFDSFKQLLREKKDIAVTHSTFLNIDDEAIRLIREGEYTLLLDEAIDTVQPYNNISVIEKDPSLRVTRDDLPHLFSGGYVEMEEQSTQLRWTSKRWERFSVLERLCKQGKVFSARNNELLVVFPPETFDAFKEVYVFLYFFEGTFFCPYIKKFGISYTLHGLEQDDAGTYHLIEYDREKDMEYRQYLKQLIGIVGGEGKYSATALSKAWYQRATPEKLQAMCASMTNFFRKKCSAKARDAMWSCPECYKDKLKPKGYIHTRRLTCEERDLPKEELDQIKKDISCFVACNARATNKYSERSALAYCINFYPNLDVESFFTDGEQDLAFSRDLFAVQVLIQWMFRSRLRNGEPIKLYIPSARMEELLRGWLDGEIG